MMACNNNNIHYKNIPLSTHFAEQNPDDPLRKLYNLFEVHQQVLQLSDIAYKECNKYPEMLIFYTIMNDQKRIFTRLQEITEKKMIIIPVTDFEINISNKDQRTEDPELNIIMPLSKALEKEKKTYKEIKNHTTDKELILLAEEAISIISKHINALKIF